jgi:hypothetical protein
MTIRVLLDSDKVIQDISVRMDSAPSEICPEIVGRFENLRGPVWERVGTLFSVFASVEPENTII